MIRTLAVPDQERAAVGDRGAVRRGQRGAAGLEPWPHREPVADLDVREQVGSWPVAWSEVCPGVSAVPREWCTAVTTPCLDDDLASRTGGRAGAVLRVNATSSSGSVQVVSCSGQRGRRVGAVAAAVADQARHPVDAVEATVASPSIRAVPSQERRRTAVRAGVVVQDQRGPSVDGLGQHPAVVHAGAGGVTGGAGRRVEHEEAGVDRRGGAAELRRAAEVVSRSCRSGPKEPARPAGEAAGVDPQDVDVPRSTVGGGAVPPGVDGARGLAGRGQPGLLGVGLVLGRRSGRPARGSPSDPAATSAVRGWRTASTRAGKPLLGQAVGLGLGARPVGEGARRGVGVRRGRRRRDEDLLGPARRGRWSRG